MANTSGTETDAPAASPLVETLIIGSPLLEPVALVSATVVSRPLPGGLPLPVAGFWAMIESCGASY